jgi:hypothetical protein
MRLREEERRGGAHTGKEKAVCSQPCVPLCYCRAFFFAGNLEFMKVAYHWETAFSVSFSRSEVEEAIESRDSYCANLSLADMKILPIIAQDPHKPKDRIHRHHLLFLVLTIVSTLERVPCHMVGSITDYIFSIWLAEAQMTLKHISRNDITQIRKRKDTTEIEEHMYKEYDQLMAVGY